MARNLEPEVSRHKYVSNNDKVRSYNTQLDVSFTVMCGCFLRQNWLVLLLALSWEE